MWIGLTNPSQQTCYSGDCDEQFHWLDGSCSYYDASYFNYFYSNEGVECVRISRNLAFDDKGCDVELPSLCQYDCTGMLDTCTFKVLIVKLWIVTLISCYEKRFRSDKVLNMISIICFLYNKVKQQYI